MKPRVKRTAFAAATLAFGWMLAAVPVQADGTTPFTTVQTFDDLGGITATAGIRYRF